MPATPSIIPRCGCFLPGGVFRWDTRDRHLRPDLSGPTTDRDCRATAPGSKSLLWVASGPAIALLDGWLLPQHPSLLGQSGGLFQHFLLLAYLWAYYHLLRQHHGFLVLYQRRLDRPIGVRVDVALLWLAGLHPYLRYALSPPIWQAACRSPARRCATDAAGPLMPAMALSLLLLLPHYLRGAPDSSPSARASYFC